MGKIREAEKRAQNKTIFELWKYVTKKHNEKSFPIKQILVIFLPVLLFMSRLSRRLLGEKVRILFDY